MSRLDRLKEELGWLTLIFGGVLAIACGGKKGSAVAWLAQNYHSAEAVISVGAFVVIMGLMVWVNRLAYQPIQQLAHRATGGIVMEWIVVAALVVLLVGLLLVVREAALHAKR